MRHWRHGTATGDWSGLRALLDPGVSSAARARRGGSSTT
jgi:hypothetical protein